MAEGLDNTTISTSRADLSRPGASVAGVSALALGSFASAGHAALLVVSLAATLQGGDQGGVYAMALVAALLHGGAAAAARAGWGHAAAWTVAIGAPATATALAWRLGTPALAPLWTLAAPLLLLASRQVWLAGLTVLALLGQTAWVLAGSAEPALSSTVVDGLMLLGMAHVLAAAAAAGWAWQAGQVDQLHAARGDSRRAVAARIDADEARNDSEDELRRSHLFLATTSHEIRTPLTGLVGMTDLLGGTRLSEEQRRYVRSIQSASETLSGIVDNVLHYSRIAAGRVDLHPRDVDLRDLVADVVDLYARRAEERRLDLAVFLDQRLETAVTVDPVRLRQVLGNLVSNAVKYTGEGSVRLDVQIVGLGAEELAIRFDVADTGPGIAQDEQATLFEPFRRVGGPTTRDVPGVGLGLSVSHTLVEHLGGTLHCESQPGFGSRFWFELSLPCARQTAIPELRSRRVRGSRLALVGLRPLPAEAVGRQLGAWGADVTRTEALDELVSRYGGSSAPGAILFDQTSQLDGWRQELGRLRRHKAFASVPVVLLASRLEPVSSSDAVAAGAFDALRSPPRPRELLDVLEQALSGEASRAAERSAAPEQTRVAANPSARVLVADDNSLNRDVIQTYLSQLGVVSHAVGDGRAAVEAARDRHYDLILMDIHMPQLSGVEATNEIRAGRGPSAQTPIVAVTADARAEFLQGCVNAGMTDALAKPLSRNKLKDVLTRFLPGWSEPGRDRPLEVAPDLRDDDYGDDNTEWADRTVPSRAPAPAGLRAAPAFEDSLRKATEPSGEAEAATVRAEPLDHQRRPGSGTPEAPILTDPFLDSTDLVEKFVQSNKETLARIRDAIAAEDWAEGKAAAHYLKSNCALAGATAAWDTCKRLEELLKRGEGDRAGMLLKLLTEELDSVSGNIRQLGPGMRPSA